MPEPRDHAENRNFIESILRHIPGFRGYLEKEYRRDSDELQRKWLADRLQRAKPALDELSRRLVDARQLDLLPQIDRVRARLEKLIWRIRSAVQGYSGFFDLVQVDENTLDRVYEHDMMLLAQVETLAKGLEELPQRQASAAAAIPELMQQIDQLYGSMDARQGLLAGTQ